MRTLLLIPLAACSAYNLNAEAPDSTGVFTSEPPTDTGDPPVIEEGWASFDGTLVVEEGEAQRTDVTLGLWEPDAFGAPRLACTVPLSVEAPARVVPPADPITPYGMWQVSTVNPSCLGTPTVVPLGIGPLPRELWPAADAAGVSTRQTRGLYTVWNGDLVIFGLAGTQQQLDGRGAPTTLDPLPDGTYRLLSSYLLEL